MSRNSNDCTRILDVNHNRVAQLRKWSIVNDSSSQLLQKQAIGDPSNRVHREAIHLKRHRLVDGLERLQDRARARDHSMQCTKRKQNTVDTAEDAGRICSRGRRIQRRWPPGSRACSSTWRSSEVKRRRRLGVWSLGMSHSNNQLIGISSMLSSIRRRHIDFCRCEAQHQ